MREKEREGGREVGRDRGRHAHTRTHTHTHILTRTRAGTLQIHTDTAHPEDNIACIVGVVRRRCLVLLLYKAYTTY